jgi:hypothetical protein
MYPPELQTKVVAWPRNLGYPVSFVPQRSDLAEQTGVAIISPPENIRELGKMHSDRHFERRRALRGNAYTLEEFRSRYGLHQDVAESLFYRFGPSSIELDILMAAKKRVPSIHVITQEMGR